MTWQSALEIVVSRTRHERFRFLTSDLNPDAVQREAYRRSVVALATHEPPPPEPLIPLPEAVRLLSLVRICQYRSTAGCGCGGARCGITGRPVSTRECLECVERYPE